MKENDLSGKVNFIFITKGLKVLKYLSNKRITSEFCNLSNEVMGNSLFCLDIFQQLNQFFYAINDTYILR